MAAILSVDAMAPTDLDSVLNDVSEVQPGPLLPVSERQWQSLTASALTDSLTRGSYVVRKPSGPWCAYFFAFEQDQKSDARCFSCVVSPQLDAGGVGSALLAFATRLAAAKTKCVVATGPFRAAEGAPGGDVEPRMSQGLAAANFTRAAGPALRVYRL